MSDTSQDSFWRKIRQINKVTLRHSLRSSVKEGASYSAMVGFGKEYLSTFAVFLKASSMHLAMLNSFPTLVSGIFQLFGAKITDYTGERMKLILHAVLLQALMWIPLFFMAFFFETYSILLVILFSTLISVFEAVFAPAWNSLMSDIVKAEERGAYFGKRNKVCGAVSFLSIVSAGLILSFFEGTNKWIGFFILFSIACIARIVSYIYMHKIYEPTYKVELAKKYTFTEFFKSMKDSNFGKFVVFNALFKFSENIASPFFIPFLLMFAGYSYFQLMIALCASTVTSFLVMMYWGKNADLFGNRNVLIICALLIPLIPLSWTISNNLWWIVIAQCFSGFVWSGYNLASSNFIFDTVPAEKRVKGVAIYNFFWGVTLFVGSLIGGLLVVFFTNTHPNYNSWIGSPYELVFIISASLRLITVVLYLPSFKEVRRVNKTNMPEMFFELVAVKPISGMAIRTVHSFEHTVGFIKEEYHHHEGDIKKVVKAVEDITDEIDEHSPIHFKNKRKE